MRSEPSIFTSPSSPSQRGERGVQLVEVAIVLPVLLLLLAVTAEFGRYFYYYSTLSSATRTAIRHIVTNEYTGSFQTEAKNLAVCGSKTACASGTEILPGLTTANFSITSTGANTNFPDTVTVQVVDYTYQPIFDLGNFVSGVSWSSVPVSPSTTMRFMLTN